MRVAILSPHYGIVYRGVETIVSYLKRGFERYDYSVDIFTLGKSREKGIFHIRGLRRGSLANNFLFRVFRKIGVGPLADPGYLHNAALSIGALPRLLFRNYDVIINFAGFIPLGFVFIATFVKTGGFFERHGALITVILCLTVSLTIEIFQAWMPSRSSDYLDLVLNTLGALLGVITYRFLLMGQASCSFFHR